MNELTELHVEAQPTAWESIPGLVRIAVWVWAILLLLSVVLGILLGVLFGVLISGPDTPDIPDIVVPTEPDPGFSVPTEGLS